MSLMNSVIVWFRRDLRIANNAALDYAMRHGKKVIPVYIEHADTEWSPGAASRWWCYQSLLQLKKSLARYKLRLRFFTGKPQEVLPRIVTETGATVVCWNNLYEPYEIRTEKDLQKKLSNIEIRTFDQHTLFKPGTLLNNQDEAYRVFTPFWKKARMKLEISGISITPSRKAKSIETFNKRLQDECTLEELGLLDVYPWHTKLHRYWTPGEATAKRRLQQFIRTCIDSYDIDRDIPAIDGTSKLSAHLHFGEITPAQIIYELQQYHFTGNAQKSAERFITELGWREFAHHVLWHFPHTATQAMYDKFSTFWPKKPNKKLLTAWQTGDTGIPIVDAGMRQLWETGWMHNRVRMIVGSLLTKNLGIHWLHGARWFWDTLVDADLASNTLGWQWVAGCGVDAAPYYRIFNPDTQARRFDPDISYIGRWVPEMNELMSNPPIIDIKQSRETALARYKNI